jgi:serine/threonine protein kinase
VRRFQQEARAASALNHPNMIIVYEIGQVDDLHFIATEYIAGQTLRSAMAKGGTESPRSGGHGNPGGERTRAHSSGANDPPQQCGQVSLAN